MIKKKEFSALWAVISFCGNRPDVLSPNYYSVLTDR